MPKKVSEYSMWKEAALVVALLTACINFIGFVSTAWAQPTDRIHDKDFEGLGLWQFCSHALEEIGTGCIDTATLDMPSWFEATQAMMAIGFTLSSLALIVTIVSECAKRYRGDQRVLVAAIALGLAATLFNVIGLIVFGTCIHTCEPLTLPEDDDYTYDVDWSYVTCSVAALCSMFVSVFLIVELIYGSNTQRYTGRAGAQDQANAYAVSSGRLDQSFSPYTSFPVLEDSS